MESHAHSALTGIAVVALAALACGMVMERLRQPAIVGYIVAGALLGPSGLALVEDRTGIDSLAELGVLLLLFLIGMELSLRAFRRVWRLALGVTVLQITASVGVMLLCSRSSTPWPRPSCCARTASSASRTCAPTRSSGNQMRCRG